MLVELFLSIIAGVIVYLIYQWLDKYLKKDDNLPSDKPL